MGVDIGHRSKGPSRKLRMVSENPYMRLLFRLYKFLARRTNSPFNRVMMRRLALSRTNRPPVGLEKIARLLEGKSENVIVVVVATITNDLRQTCIPKMTVAALRVTEAARARIEKAGGKVLTLDQLALLRPTGSNTLLIQGSRRAREAYRHFLGVRGKSFAPYVPFKAKVGGKNRSRGCGQH